jgi:hypothetical protein
VILQAGRPGDALRQPAKRESHSLGAALAGEIYECVDSRLRRGLGMLDTGSCHGLVCGPDDMRPRLAKSLLRARMRS